MHVGQAMIAEVASCSGQESLRTAAERLRAGNCGSLPVVDGHGRVVGMLTDRDVCMAAVSHDARLSELRVAEAMSRAAYTCGSEDDLTAAERLMREHQVRRLPVVGRDGKLVGIISVDDLAREALRKGSRLDGRAVLETLVATSHYKQLQHGSA